MAMLFPPAEEIVLYETGFDEDDLLNRRETGKRLSELLERVEQPVVIALDGQWGSGKTYFLKRWVGAHTLQNHGVATTIYFDAFANDYFDDPLIGLTAALGERLPEEKPAPWQQVKNLATRLSRPGLRIGLAAATAGATEVADPILDAAIRKGSEQAERAADDIWKQEVGRQAAMDRFRDALDELTGESGRLILVVDELDRCRPDYALAMLEVIKHFFEVPNVHFVLGVNMEALGHIVRARYGGEVKANDYLKRFISLTMELPEYTDSNMKKPAPIEYFRNRAEVMCLTDFIKEGMAFQLGLVLCVQDVSLRDIEKLLTRLAILPRRSEIETSGSEMLMIVLSLVLMQTIRPDLFKRALGEQVEMREIEDFFGLGSQKDESLDNMRKVLRDAWQYIVDKDAMAEEDRQSLEASFRSPHYFFGRDTIMRDLRARYFSTFHLVE